MKNNNDDLDHIMKKIDKYLEEKRRGFSRFYFISNDELLNMLSNANNIDIIKDNLKKMFENVNSITQAGDET